MLTNIAALNIESYIFCIIIISILLYKQIFSLDHSESQHGFTRVLISQIVFFSVNLCCELTAELPSLHTPGLVFLAYAAHCIVFSVSAYECFAYIVYYDGLPLLSTRKRRVLALLPMIFNIVVVALSPITGLGFTVTPQAEPVAGPMWLPCALVCLFYPLFGIAVNHFCHLDRDREVRARQRLMLAFPLVVFFAAALQLLNRRLPILAHGVVLADMIVYVNYADSLISKDPLTGINNRSELSRYLASRFRPETGRDGLYYFIMDIDKFKNINDEYGHGEGDRALVLLANALKRVSASQEQRCFIARYGGDEFVLAAELPSDEAAEALAARIREAVAGEARRAGAPYSLLASVGYARFGGPGADTVPGLMAAADAMLYQQKQVNSPGGRSRTASAGWPRPVRRPEPTAPASTGRKRGRSAPAHSHAARNSPRSPSPGRDSASSRRKTQWR